MEPILYLREHEVLPRIKVRPVFVSDDGREAPIKLSIAVGARPHEIVERMLQLQAQFGRLRYVPVHMFPIAKAPPSTVFAVYVGGKLLYRDALLVIVIADEVGNLWDITLSRQGRKQFKPLSPTETILVPTGDIGGLSRIRRQLTHAQLEHTGYGGSPGPRFPAISALLLRFKGWGQRSRCKPRA